MKRILAVVFVMVLALLFVACGSSSNEEVEVVFTKGITEAVTINESVLVDEADVKITARSFEANGDFGPEIKLLIENNSDKDLTFQSRTVYVNGYMVETLMSVDVACGKKANDSLTFMEADLENCGIEDIGEIELTFHIFDFERWDTIVDTDVVSITF